MLYTLNVLNIVCQIYLNFLNPQNKLFKFPVLHKNAEKLCFDESSLRFG